MKKISSTRKGPEIIREKIIVEDLGTKTRWDNLGHIMRYNNFMETVTLL